MADNLLDREKAYRAVVIPSVGNVRADGVLRSLQDALNRTGLPLMHQKFRNVTRKEPIDVSGNPYYDSVMDVVSNPPNTIMNSKGNRLVPNWNFYLLDNKGMKRNAYDLFRQSFDDRINEYIPSYNRALRTNPFETPEIYEGLDNGR